MRTLSRGILRGDHRRGWDRRGVAKGGFTVLCRRRGFRKSVLALATGVALFGGCVRKDFDAGATVYRYEPGAWVALLVGGAGLALLSLWIYRKSRPNRFIERVLLVGIIVPPIVAVAFVPKMVRDRIRVDADGF